MTSPPHWSFFELWEYLPCAAFSVYDIETDSEGLRALEAPKPSVGGQAKLFKCLFDGMRRAARCYMPPRFRRCAGCARAAREGGGHQKSIENVEEKVLEEKLLGFERSWASKSCLSKGIEGRHRSKWDVEVSNGPDLEAFGARDPLLGCGGEEDDASARQAALTKAGAVHVAFAPDAKGSPTRSASACSA